MIKFGVFADLHVDIIGGAERRLKQFLDDCRREDVDFVIQLGDFCYPDSVDCHCKPENRPENIENAINFPSKDNKDAIVGMYRDFEKPAYHVLGNHDCDLTSKQQVLDYYKTDCTEYYSFDMGGIHFVVIDPNYYRLGDEYFSFDHGNYFDAPSMGGSLPWLPPKQVEWLKNDLENAKYPSVIFSHQRLIEGPWSIKNYEEVQKIMENAPKKVLMSLNGHEHLDDMEEKNGIYYYNVNSMSNFWVGDKYKVMGRYGEQVDHDYPNVRYIIPYDGPAYSIIELDENGANIKGTKSTEHGVTSRELGLYKGQDYYGVKLHCDITANSKDRVIKFK